MFGTGNLEHAARMIYLTSDLEVRQLGSQPVISGKFPYGSMAVLSDRGTVRKEQIMPGAFDFTLSNPLAQVNLLFGHSFDKPLASRSSGTLKLEDTAEFLKFTATIPPGAERASHIVDALAMIGSGLATGISPGFRVPPKSAVADAERLVPEEGNPGVMIRELWHLNLFELSIVTRPAYSDATAELRAWQAYASPAPKPAIAINCNPKSRGRILLP